MKACEQAPGFSIYDHGLAVANRYRDLYAFLATCASPGVYEWHLPAEALAELRRLRHSALTPQQARIYHVFHDCGKPSTLSVDERGKRHFPDHAEASAKLFAAAAPHDKLTTRLISKDMLCHTTRTVDCGSLIRDPDFPTLMLTAWAELHANASALFGGFESDSFKIKRKALCKLLKRYSQLSTSEVNSNVTS